MISLAIFTQAQNVLGFTIESNHAPRRSYKSRRTECVRAEMCTDVIDYVTQLDHCRDGILDVELVLTAPKTGLRRNAKGTPEALREAGLHLHPGRAARERAAAHEILRIEERNFRFRPPAK